VKVRRARREDAAAIAAVHVTTWQSAYAGIFGEERLSGVEVRPDAWERRLAQPDELDVLVVERDGAVVAFASLGPSRDGGPAGELYAIYALPEAWGTGAGAALMREALGALRARGFAAATLWVLEDNPRARRFYEREGWALDTARREGEHLGVTTVELRYRIAL
jgi:GNAT superfamily N-acetyltransferase